MVDREITVGGLTLFIVGTDLFIVAPLLPSITVSLDISITIGGWLVTIYAIIYGLAAPFVGKMADRYGRKPFILVGLILLTVANLSLGLGDGFLQACMSRGMSALAAAFIVPQVFALISQESAYKKSSERLPIVVTGFLSALWLASPLALFVSEQIGWRPVFLIIAVLSIAFIFINQICWHEFDENDVTIEKTNLHTLLVSVSVTVLWSIAMYSFYTYIGAALKNNMFTDRVVALGIFLYGAGAVTGSLVTAPALQYTSVQKLPRWTTVLMAIFLLFMNLVMAVPILLLSVIFCWSLTGYCAFTSYQTYLVHYFKNSRGEVLAWNNTALYIGMAFGSWIGGLIISNLSYGSLPFICSLFGFLSLVLIIKVNWIIKGNIKDTH